MLVPDSLIPRALYPCADDRCMEEQTFPPDELAYYSGSSDTQGDSKPGFYCDICADQLGLDNSPFFRRVTLSEALESKRVTDIGEEGQP